jgi:hypothetical protein
MEEIVPLIQVTEYRHQVVVMEEIVPLIQVTEYRHRAEVMDRVEVMLQEICPLQLVLRDMAQLIPIVVQQIMPIATDICRPLTRTPVGTIGTLATTIRRKITDIRSTHIGGEFSYRHKNV